MTNALSEMVMTAPLTAGPNFFQVEIGVVLVYAALTVSELEVEYEFSGNHGVYKFPPVDPNLDPSQ